MEYKNKKLSYFASSGKEIYEHISARKKLTLKSETMNS